VRFVSKPDGSKCRVAVRGGEELHVLRKPTKKPARTKSAPKKDS